MSIEVHVSAYRGRTCVRIGDHELVSASRGALRAALVDALAQLSRLDAADPAGYVADRIHHALGA